MQPNQQAFLNMLAVSEGTSNIPGGCGGYRVLVGSTPTHPLLFQDYSTHPNILNRALNSTAAGKYQIIHRTFVGLCEQGGYADFEPATQDQMALDLISGREARDDVINGNFDNAVAKCSAEWASLSFSTAGEHTNSLDYLRQVYVNFGGMLCQAQP